MTGVIVAAVVLAILACICVILFIPPRGFRDLDDCREKLAQNRYIIHAGGYVTDPDGNVLSYTNTLDSLYNCYEQGTRISEFDLMRTSDGKIVCAHDSEEEDEWAYGRDMHADQAGISLARKQRDRSDISLRRVRSDKRARI